MFIKLIDKSDSQILMQVTEQNIYYENWIYARNTKDI